MTKKEHKRAEQLIQDIMELGHQKRAKRIELQLLTGEQGQEYCHNCIHVEMCMWYCYVGCEFRQESRPIRCWNCIHYNAETKGCKRNPSVEAWEEGDFCNYGEARGEE